MYLSRNILADRPHGSGTGARRPRNRPNMIQPSVNADPNELAKFGELAHRWWDPQGEFGPLHQINPLRLAWIERNAPLAGKTVLDVGCGGGILAEAMARAG